MIVRILCIGIIVWILIYLMLQFRKGTCSSSVMAPIKGIGKQDKRYQEKLRDYYIKSSYNSCSTGQFQNDWVNLCALENVIKQGCRCLDFEVYEVDGKAVGASQDSATGYGLLVPGKTDASGKVSFTMKNTNTADSAMAIAP